MSLRPSRGFQQFIIRGSQHVEVVGMIATALIDSRVQLEIDLIEPVDEANLQVLSIDLPDQAFRDSFRQPEPEQASISATISTSFVVLEINPVAFSAVPPHTIRLYRGAPSRTNLPFRSCKASSKLPGSLMSFKGRIRRTINDVKDQCKHLFFVPPKVEPINLFY